MINVVASLTVRPGHGGDFEAVVARARAEVIENPSCHRYDLQRVRRSEQHYMMLETWDSTAALKAHGASQAFADFSAELAGLVEASPTVTVLEPLGEQA